MNAGTQDRKYPTLLNSCRRHFLCKPGAEEIAHARRENLSFAAFFRLLDAVQLVECPALPIKIGPADVTINQSRMDVNHPFLRASPASWSRNPNQKFEHSRAILFEEPVSGFPNNSAKRANHLNANESLL